MAFWTRLSWQPSPSLPSPGPSTTQSQMSTIGVQGPQHGRPLQALPSEGPRQLGLWAVASAPTKEATSPLRPWGWEHRMHPGAQCSGHSCCSSPQPRGLMAETGNIVPNCLKARTDLCFVVLI